MGSSAGTANHGSPWFVNSPPEGSQAAFIQRDSANAYISTSVNFPAAGEYLIRFQAVRRSEEYPANHIGVKIDGTLIGTIDASSQPDDTWRPFTVTYQCPGAGDRSLSFVGLRGGGLDCASAIDEIRITRTAAEFQVKLAPGAAGIREGILTIPNNDPFDNPYRVNLRGGIAQAPGATTLGARHAKLASEQRIKGTVYPDGNPTTIAIEYGTTTAYGSSFTVTTSANGFETIPVNSVLTGTDARHALSLPRGGEQQCRQHWGC